MLSAIGFRIGFAADTRSPEAMDGCPLFFLGKFGASL